MNIELHFVYCDTNLDTKTNEEKFDVSIHLSPCQIKYLLPVPYFAAELIKHGPNHREVQTLNPCPCCLRSRPIYHNVVRQLVSVISAKSKIEHNN